MRLHTRNRRAIIGMALLAFAGIGLALLWNRKVEQIAFVNAARRGDVAAVRAYLDKGRDPNAVGYQGLTAMRAASYANNLPLVQLLLDRGANPQEGIGWAISHQNEDMVRAILKRGIDVHSRPPGYNTSPIQQAREKGNASILRLMESDPHPINDRQRLSAHERE